MMKTLSNLPPGCTSRMIDDLCSDEWRCENCGELLTDEEIEEIEENDLAELCETCAAVRRIAAYSGQHSADSIQPVTEPERFYRVAANSCDLAADSYEQEAA